jgi:hypothetical protein
LPLLSKILADSIQDFAIFPAERIYPVTVNSIQYFVEPRSVSRLVSFSFHRQLDAAAIMSSS